MSYVTKSWRPYRIEKYNSDLAKLIHGIEETMNPFNTDANDKLFYNVTGKDVPDDIRDNIIQYRELGNEWCQEFITGCSEDPARFEKPIRRRKVKTFSQAATNSNIRGKDELLVELKGTIYLFGRLLYLSTQNNIDLTKIFTYPLVPVPLSLAHVDGSMHKTDNAKLLTPPMSSVKVTLVDCMFLLHALKDVPYTWRHSHADPKAVVYHVFNS